MKIETFLTFVMVLFLTGCFITFRYLQADKNFWCMFDSSPRSCGIIARGNK